MSNYSKRRLEEEKQKKLRFRSMMITSVLIVAIIGVVVAIVWKTQAGKSETETVTEVKYDPFKYVTLGDFEGKVAYRIKPEVTDANLQESIDSLLKKGVEYKEVTERGVANNDQITIDFKGTIDGKEFDGGTSEDYKYICGQGSMISGFDEGLVGAKKGEQRTLNLKFPDDYQTATVAGKAVIFSVTVKKIEEVSVQPKWDDAFAKKSSDGKYETTAAYEEQLKEDLLTSAQKNSDSTLKSQLWKAVIDTTKVKGYPSALYKQLDSKIGSQLTTSASQWGLERDAYVKMLYGSTYKEYLVEYVNSEMIAKALTQKLKIEVKDSEYDALAKEILDDFSVTSVKKLEEAYGKDEIKAYLVNLEMFDYLTSKAEIKDVTQAEYEKIQEDAAAEQK